MLPEHVRSRETWILGESRGGVPPQAVVTAQGVAVADDQYAAETRTRRLARLTGAAACAAFAAPAVAGSHYRARSSRTVPSGPTSWIRRAILPNACVEQLRHGS